MISTDNKNKLHAFLNQRPRVTKDVAITFLRLEKWNVIHAIEKFDLCNK